MQLLRLRSVFPSEGRWTCRARSRGSPELLALSGQSRRGGRQTGWVGRADPHLQAPPQCSYPGWCFWFLLTLPKSDLPPPRDRQTDSAGFSEAEHKTRRGKP